MLDKLDYSKYTIKELFILESSNPMEILKKKYPKEERQKATYKRYHAKINKLLKTRCQKED